MASKLGRPNAILPGGVSASEHEARRLKAGLSKRTYAKKIGTPQATYIKKTLGTDGVTLADCVRVCDALGLDLRFTVAPKGTRRAAR